MVNQRFVITDNKNNVVGSLEIIEQYPDGKYLFAWWSRKTWKTKQGVAISVSAAKDFVRKRLEQ